MNTGIDTPLEPAALLLDGPLARPALPSLWLVDAAGRAGDAAARHAFDVLDAAERHRAAALRRPADRRCYVTAHVALRTVLGALLGQDGRAVQLTREPCPACGGPHGRPAVAGRSGVHFSLSHSGDLALIALAAGPVGADVERFPDPAAAAESAGALHPRETAELQALNPADGPAAFARVWTRKEAYLKGLGLGLARDPSLDYMGAGPLPAPAPGGWRIRDVPVPPSYAGAVALLSGAG